MQISVWFYIFCVAVNRASALVISQAKEEESLVSSENAANINQNTTMPFTENGQENEFIKNFELFGEHNESSFRHTLDNVTKSDIEEHLKGMQKTGELPANVITSNISSEYIVELDATENIVELDATKLNNSTEIDSSEENITLDAFDVSDLNLINTTSILSSNSTVKIVDFPTKKRSTLIAKAKSKKLPESYKGLENPPTMLPIFRHSESSPYRESFDTVPNIIRQTKNHAVVQMEPTKPQSNTLPNEMLEALVKTLNNKVSSSVSYSSIPVDMKYQPITTMANSPNTAINGQSNANILTSYNDPPLKNEPYPITNRKIPLFFNVPDSNTIRPKAQLSQISNPIQTHPPTNALVNQVGINSNQVTPVNHVGINSNSVNSYVNHYQVPPSSLNALSNKLLKPTTTVQIIKTPTRSPFQTLNFNTLAPLFCALASNKQFSQTTMPSIPMNTAQRISVFPSSSFSPNINANAAKSALPPKCNCLASNWNKAKTIIPMNNQHLLRNILSSSILSPAPSTGLNSNVNPILQIVQPSLQKSGLILTDRTLSNLLTQSDLKSKYLMPPTNERSMRKLNYQQLPKVTNYKVQQGPNRVHFNQVINKSQIAYKPKTLTFTQVYDNFLKKITLEILVPYTLSKR